MLLIGGEKIVKQRKGDEEKEEKREEEAGPRSRFMQMGNVGCHGVSLGATRVTRSQARFRKHDF